MAPEEKYVVRTRAPGRMFIGIFDMVLFVALSAALIFFNSIVEDKEPAGTIFLWIVLCSVFVLCSAFEVYRTVRPRVKVSGGSLECFPMWKRKRTADISKIDSRKSDWYNALPTLFGALGYAANRGRSTRFCLISYYMNGELMITVDSRMKNAQRLDEAVKASLNK